MRGRQLRLLAEISMDCGREIITKSLAGSQAMVVESWLAGSLDYALTPHHRVQRKPSGK